MGEDSFGRAIPAFKREKSPSENDFLPKNFGKRRASAKIKPLLAKTKALSVETFPLSVEIISLLFRPMSLLIFPIADLRGTKRDIGKNEGGVAEKKMTGRRAFFG